MEKLTTPELKEHDSVFPGENWFFYWKTSPSLWEAKLRAYQGVTPIFVPIYWSLHSEYINQYDFGQVKPETDLKRLADIAESIGKPIVFLLSIGPSPFFTNGGVPSYLSRVVSSDQENISMGVWNSTMGLNKMYSYFDPQVFQGFRKFCWNVGQFLSQSGINVPVYGLDCYKLEANRPVSFFRDRSVAFEKGFNRFVKQLQDTEPEKVERMIEDESYENTLQLDYEKVVQNLYLDTCHELLPGNWAGIISQNFLGSSSVDLLKRSTPHWDSEQEYFKQAFLGSFFNICPNSLLVDPRYKKDALGKCLMKLVDHNQVQKLLDSDYYSEEASLSFKPLYHFHLFWNEEKELDIIKQFKKSGLLNFLDRVFPWQYHVAENLDADFEEFDESSVYIAFGKFVNESELKKIFKYFLNGQKIFIDLNGMDEKLAHKLEFFFAENNLQKEVINFLCTLQKVSLGEGLIITFDSEKLSKSAPQKTLGFWEKVVGFVDLKYLPVEIDDGVFYKWNTRSSNAYELNYAEVRRISLFNPTSYKRRAHVKSSSSFAFIKTLDTDKAQVKSTPIGVDIELLPGGSITLDYGYFEA